MVLECPICGEPLPIPAPAFCPACETELSGEVLSLSNEWPRGESAPPPAKPLMEETDELLAVFRAQFEEHCLSAPASWSNRLRALALEAEPGRRMATVFFVDIRGYTRISREVTAAEHRELRSWFAELCTRHVERHSGFVIQALGDAIYAAFGAPWAFERDSESALRALLGIFDEVKRKAEFAGQPLALRAGAAWGLVQIGVTHEGGRPRPDVFGSAVNLANRLESQAETWDILISDDLAEQVRPVFELAEGPLFEPKNYGDVVQSWRVLRYRGTETPRRPELDHFIGRDRERALLSERMNRLRHHGSFATRICGEAGIGKTALLNVAVAGLSDVEVLRECCDPSDRHLLLGAITRLLDGLAGLTSEMGRECKHAALCALLDESEAAGANFIGYVLGIATCTAALRSCPAEMIRAGVVTTLASLLARGGRNSARPRLIVVDDVQWLDELSWQVLDDLRNREDPGVGVLLAARHDPFASSDRVRSTDGGVDCLWESLPLEPLAPDERVAILRQILDLDSLHVVTRRHLLEELEGNPLYLVETARELLNTRERLAEPRPPGSLREILQARVDRLSIQRRSVLQSSSLLGRRFSRKVVRVLESRHAELELQLMALKTSHLLQDARIGGDEGLRFAPSVLRDVAYEMISEERRQELHGFLADGLEALFANRLEDVAWDLARHWDAAGNKVKARRYTRRAARQASLLGAPDQAVSLLQSAVESLRVEADASPVARGQLVMMLEDLAEVWKQAGDLDRAAEVLLELQAVARKAANCRWLYTAHLQLAYLETDRSDYAKAEQWLDELPSAPDQAHELMARNTRAIAWMHTGRALKALATFEDVAAKGSAMEPVPEAVSQAMNNAGLVLWNLGRLDEALQRFRSVQAAYSKSGNLFDECLVLINCGIIEEKRAPLRQADETYQRAQEIADCLGYEYGLTLVDVNRANLQLLMGEPEQGRTLSARAIARARRGGHPFLESVALENLGVSEGRLGRWSEACLALEEAARIGQAIGDPDREASPWLARAVVALVQDRPEELAECLARSSRALDPDLHDARRVLMATLNALESRNASGFPTIKGLRGLLQTGSREAVLRWIDAIDFLGRAGICCEVSEQVPALRREARHDSP